MIYSDADIGQWIQDFVLGCHLLLAIQNIHWIEWKEKSLGLDFYKYLVLTEADQILYMGFDSEMCGIVKQEAILLKGVHYTLMFIATFHAGS